MIQDEAALVRKHTFLLLSQLLLQDFLKWKGMLLYRFLAITVDADLELAALAKYSLTRSLLLKFPNIFSNNFAECIIVSIMNEYMYLISILYFFIYTVY